MTSSAVRNVIKLHQWSLCKSTDSYAKMSRDCPFNLGLTVYNMFLSFDSEPIDEKCQPPTDEEVQAMEHFVPVRSYSVTFLKPCIWVKAADLPMADLKKKWVTSQRRNKKVCQFSRQIW